MPDSLEDFVSVYEYEPSCFFHFWGKPYEQVQSLTIVCREFWQKPKLLRNNYQIDGDELLQTVCKNVFIDFRQAKEKWKKERVCPA